MINAKWPTVLFLAAALTAGCNSQSGGGKDAATGPIPGTEGYPPDKIELAKKSNCFSCHAMEKKMIGPSFKDVAAKYRGDSGAEEKLVTRVAKGSSGAWGSIPMPANSPPVTEAEIRTLVQFTLSLN